MMRRLAGVALLLLAAFYGYRAWVGWTGGRAFVQGRRLAQVGEYDRALPKLDRGAVGEHRSVARWLAGQVRVAQWQQAMAEGAAVAEADALFAAAYRDYTAALAESPALGWYWVDLGDLYHQHERVVRRREGVALESIGDTPWSAVGQPGRIAIGLIRIGIEREPNWYAFHDRLAFALRDYSLVEPMRAAVRKSAEVQPIFRQHAYLNLRPVPPDILNAFAEGARDALDGAPLLRRTLHWIAIGRIEWRRGEWVAAVEAMERALELPGDRLNRAEASYYLGLSLFELGRLEEAGEALDTAMTHVNLQPAALSALARLSEAEGDLAAAERYAWRARDLNKRRLDLILEHARLARALGEVEKAEAALRWGMTVYPTATAPREALIRLFLGAGDPVAARQEIDAWQIAGGDPSRIERWRLHLAGSAP